MLNVIRNHISDFLRSSAELREFDTPCFESAVKYVSCQIHWRHMLTYVRRLERNMSFKIILKGANSAVFSQFYINIFTARYLHSMKSPIPRNNIQCLKAMPVCAVVGKRKGCMRNRSTKCVQHVRPII